MYIGMNHVWTLCALIGLAACYDGDDEKKDLMEKQRGHYKHWYPLLVHFAFGAVTKFIIVKIILGIVFFYTLTKTIYMLGWIKHLFKDVKISPVYVKEHHPHYKDTYYGNENENYGTSPYKISYRRISKIRTRPGYKGIRNNYKTIPNSALSYEV